MRNTLFIFITTSVFLAGCSSSDRYSIKDDIAPKAPISVDHIEDAQPQYEPYSLGGNRNYTLRGVNYTIIKDSNGFTEKGQASWYGKKFHGHLTSNGEIYDMYSMTAAHKTLPLPSYVQVTNLDNQKTTVVRVNDRGPFHEGRIIDLSYAAAYKLGVVQTGTANVEIKVITVEKPNTTKPTNRHPKYIIQVASSKYEDRTRTLSQDLSQKLSVESFVDSVNDSHRVFLGPFNDYSLTQQALEKVKLLGYETAFIKKQPVTQ
ncbi:septal ring lytic transglycosylase RlpA family protein [Vibrio aestuarianus]|uniref:Endolytic peptidoglycan transglycosylase RlpA n=1 Tax=Vibrio aestuarianus TaxID=28171 RepID=A0AAX3U4X3_9VIBR|nr:septal ring lytic transglycosylase RlpA family protein [Vibrio aestuarianus]MDE1237960.1 septal ring lytic transglycosylase RlpA family protein [Vibrio aestuarianus]WGK82185.1 septal ring lytic transglycosylase RlpA family protein [Vibrio aestuarianus]